MRKFTLLFATLILLALAGTASAVECSSCTEPCTGPYGDNFQCSYDGNGPYGQCTSRANCRGCFGWFAQQCLYFADLRLESEKPEPLLGVRRVTAVVVRHDPRPVEPPYQLAAAR
jgi:hypothetical protein